MLTIMVMLVPVFMPFRFMPVALFLVFPHFDETHRLATGTVVMAITSPVALMSVWGFNHNDPVIHRVGIGKPHMAMDAR
jgi:uncharacterized membrane protein YqjE